MSRSRNLAVHVVLGRAQTPRVCDTPSRVSRVELWPPRVALQVLDELAVELKRVARVSCTKDRLVVPRLRPIVRVSVSGKVAARAWGRWPTAAVGGTRRPWRGSSELVSRAPAK